MQKAVVLSGSSQFDEGRLRTVVPTRQYNALCPVHSRHCKCSFRRRRTTPSLPRAPDCDEGRLRGRFLHTAKAICSQENWYSHVLLRIGCETGLDHAAKAFASAFALSSPISQACSSQYYQSLKSLQTACQTKQVSDADLLTVMLCFFYEVRATATGSFPHVHGDGVAAMLTSKSSRHWKGDVSRTVFYTLGTLIFHNSVVQGRPSYFDNGNWIDFGPPKMYSPCNLIRKLRHLGQILLIRLPRLILLVREYELAENRSSAARKLLASIITELLAVESCDAEQEALSTLLHFNSSSSIMAAHYQYSYAFKDHAHFQALTIWWTGRLILMRLAAKVRHLFMQEHDPSDNMFLRSTSQHEGQQRQLCDHILKSLEYTASLSPMSQWPYLLAVQPVFGALDEVTVLDKDGTANLQSTLTTWYAGFLEGLNMPQQNATVLMYLSNILNGGSLS